MTKCTIYVKLYKGKKCYYSTGHIIFIFGLLVRFGKIIEIFDTSKMMYYYLFILNVNISQEFQLPVASWPMASPIGVLPNELKCVESYVFFLS